MAVAPTYSWVLLFRLVQGLVSKACWVIGYILSKRLRLSRESAGWVLPGCRQVVGWQAQGPAFQAASRRVSFLRQEFLKSCQSAPRAFLPRRT